MNERMLRVRIEKEDGAGVVWTKITDADTGEEVEQVFAYTLVADVKEALVQCTLSRFEEPLRVDLETNEIPTYEQEVEVVHLETDAIEVDPCSSSTPSAPTDQPSTAESDPT